MAADSARAARPAQNSTTSTTQPTATANPQSGAPAVVTVDSATPCRGVLSADRMEISSDSPCSIKIAFGSAISVVINEDTISTVWVGDETLLVTNHRGDRIDRVLAGTFRPISAGWDRQQVTANEVNYYEFEHP